MWELQTLKCLEQQRKSSSPIVGAKPVEGCVKLDDVRAKENIISHLGKEKYCYR